MGEMYEWGVSFDYFKAILHTINLLRGHKAFFGTLDEKDELKKRGISCHAAMLDPITGEYLLQVPKRDYRLACKILGGKR